jgi:ribosomal protein S18 acetylase RimI-like enzyme
LTIPIRRAEPQYGGLKLKIKIKQICDNSKQDNIDRFIDTFLKLFNDDKNLFFLSFTNIPFDRKTIENWLIQARQVGVEYYTACDEGGSIVGILTIRFNTIEAFEILAIAVDGSCRNMGIGSLLIETAMDRAKEKGFKTVDVAVFSDNRNMLSLAVKNYYKPVKIEYRKRFDGEDIVYLRRYLK